MCPYFEQGLGLVKLINFSSFSRFLCLNIMNCPNEQREGEYLSFCSNAVSYKSK